MGTFMKSLAIAAATAGLLAGPADAASKKAPAQKETVVQRSATRTIEQLAAQVVADFRRAQGAQVCQAVAYPQPGSSVEAGRIGLGVVFPFGVDLITEGNGEVKNCGTGEYELGTGVDLPTDVKHLPGAIDFSYVASLHIGESVFGGGEYSLSIEGDRGARQAHQWDVLLEITPPQGASEQWRYTAGSGMLNKGSHTSYSQLTMPELKAVAGQAQTILENAPRYVATPIGALSFPFPPTP